MMERSTEHFRQVNKLRMSPTYKLRCRQHVDCVALLNKTPWPRSSHGVAP